MAWDSQHTEAWASTLDHRAVRDGGQAPARPLRRQSLVRRLTWMSSALLGTVLLVSGLVLGLIVFYEARDLQVRTAEQAAVLLADNLAPTLAFEQREAAEQALKGFRGRIDLRALALWHADGRLFAQVQMPGSLPLSWVAAQSQTQLDSGQLTLVRPVQLQGETIGWLGWRESFATLRATLLRLALSGLAALLLAVVAAVVLLNVLQRRALKPLVALSRLAEHVASAQDYSLRAEVARPDEVGRLAERFNDMMRRIEIWHADLHAQLQMEQQTGQQLRQLAHRDTLTGLPNRLSFEVELERQLLESQIARQRMALLFIDLDNFKQVNDLHGHAAGDAVLIEASQRMRRCLRPHDLLCRLGGDEFALLVPQVQDAYELMQLAEQLITAVREPMVAQGHAAQIGATVGMAFSPDHGLEPHALLRAADEAMYAAKRAGKNTYRCAPDAQPNPTA